MISDEEVATIRLTLGRCRLVPHWRLCACGKSKFKATAHSLHGLPVAPNLRERRLTVAAPKRVWAAGIATVWTEERWCDRAVVIDLFSGQMVGFAMDERTAWPLVIDGSWPGSVDDPRTG